MLTNSMCIRVYLEGKTCADCAKLNPGLESWLPKLVDILWIVDFYIKNLY